MNSDAKDGAYSPEDFRAAQKLPESGCEKYLYVKATNMFGMNHLKWALGLHAQEAFFLRRTLLVSRPMLSPGHNFGRRLDVPWSKYINLKGIFLKIDNARQPVKVKRLEEVDPKGLSVLNITNDHRVLRGENEAYDLIVRDDPDGLSRGKDRFYDSVKWPCDIWSSSEIERIAAGVKAKLEDYTAVHVRRGDKLHLKEWKEKHPNLERDTQPLQIIETLRRILPTANRIYILTNETDRNFFDPLRQVFDVFQYFDFPELRCIVEDECPDNHFLYEIEKRLFSQARDKIFTFADREGKRLSLTRDIGTT